ncbi:MAG: hypothetical protein ABIH24_04625 [Verrucomicrobiota bacterium]
MNLTTDFLQDEGADMVTRRLIFATLAQAFVVLLAGLNLCLKLSAHYVGPFDLVRWREIFSLLVIVPVSVGIMFQVAWILEQGRRDAKWPITLMGVFACLLGISMGVHEPINALPHHHGLPVLEFWDEIFSHGVFFLAFAGISLSLLWSQIRNPLPAVMSLRTTAVFGCIAILAGAGIFLTLLPGGSIGIDLAIIALVLFAAEWMRKGKPMRQLPLAMVIEWPCLLAFIGLVAQRFLSGR